ncbi:MAG: HAD-IA family hydrolase [Candidatus Omnitrophica bacterium]|nr:HAD-IA family hydrolase [Candidatus Omnitrophota bacterium]
MKHYDGVIFDLDGVVTKTAMAHALSWKEMFEAYFRLREKRDKEPFKEFVCETDYVHYIDGRPRYKGVENFLKAKGINLPHGDKDDPAGKETICGLGNEKDVRFKRILEEKGIEVYESTVALIKNLKLHHVRVAVASSSKNCAPILKKTGLEELFEARIDGVVSSELGLKGKPESDIFVTAAKHIHCAVNRSVVVEDAVAGVQAGKKGNFALVIGVARQGNDKELKEHGADIVVNTFHGVDANKIEEWVGKKNMINPKP